MLMGASRDGLPQGIRCCPSTTGQCPRIHEQACCGEPEPAAEPTVANDTVPLEGEAATSDWLERLPQSANEDEPDFELWVEAEIQADWCLGSLHPCSIQPTCTTSTLRRRWEDFEELVAPSCKTRDNHIKHTCLPGDSLQSLSTLGVAKGADSKEIRSAFRHLARVCHPDKPEGSKEAFHDLVTAYHTACNLAVDNKLARSM